MDWNISLVLAHSVLYFAKEEWGGEGVQCCSPKIPSPPDPSVSYINGLIEELRQYPDVRAVEAAAKTGEKAYDQNGNLIADFTGIGDANYQAKFADQMASALLNLQKKHGNELIRQRLLELETSDPEGFQARKDLYARIIGGIEAGAPDYEAAMALESEVLGDLERGATLSPRRLQEVEQTVRGAQVARGGGYGLADATMEAGAVEAVGRSQLNAAQQRALDFLTSGASQEDKEYRRDQQNMANLGAFLSGTTPVAQFGQLSGAQAGVVPFQGGQPLPGPNQNAGLQNIANQFSQYTANANWASQQANPLMAGLGLGFQGAAAAALWMPTNNAGLASTYATGGFTPTGTSYNLTDF